MSEIAAITILAIDPGSAKCGIAVVSSPGAQIQYRSIVETALVAAEVGQLLQNYPEISLAIVGSGTGGKALCNALKSEHPSLRVEPVDETNTSMLARQRYCLENQPAGWRRIIPLTMRVPDKPYDDYVAVILAERRLADNSTKPNGAT